MQDSILTVANILTVLGALVYLRKDHKEDMKNHKEEMNKLDNKFDSFIKDSNQKWYDLLKEFHALDKRIDLINHPFNQENKDKDI